MLCLQFHHTHTHSLSLSLYIYICMLHAELHQALQPLVNWHTALGPGAEHYLHMAGGCMYGLVVALHLLSLFSAPDVLSAVQGLL